MTPLTGVCISVSFEPVLLCEESCYCHLMSEDTELLEVEKTQSLEESAAAMRAPAGLLETADGTVTVAYDGSLAVVSGPRR